jgi:hypothetical protein
LTAEHRLDDDRRRADVDQVNVQAMFFIVTRFLGDPPRQAGGADRSEGKGNSDRGVCGRDEHAEEATPDDEKYFSLPAHG